MDSDTNVSLKFTNKVSNEAKLKRYVETLKQINGLVSGIDTQKMKEIKDNSSMNKATKETKDNIQTINKTLNIAKLGVFVKSIGQITQKLSSFTKKSADYLENWNLLDVAFQNNTVEAEKFVNTLTEMYGLDESWGYRTVGIFKQLGNAMGLADEVGTKLANTLTQLAIDTSSLYNIDVNDTVSILQSGLAGGQLVWLA